MTARQSIQALLAQVDVHLERWAQQRARVPTDAALADALRAFAASSRAGLSVRRAFHRAAEHASGTVGGACSAAAADLGIGRSVEVAVQRFAARVGTPSAELFARVVHVQHRRGGSLATPCHRLASLLRDRSRLEAEARSATAQARFSARAVIAIPVVLAVLAAWRSPDTARAFLQPMQLFLASPGIIAIVAGGVLAQRIARGAVRVGDVTAASGAQRDGPIRPILRRIAGSGSLATSGIRLAAAAAVLGMALGARAGMSGRLAGCVAVLVLVGSVWPVIDRRRARARIERVASSGADTVLEVSIALFTAGATAHEVAMAAPAAAPEPLRSALRPALDRMQLGRGIASSFADVPEVHESPQLDGWLHAVCTCAELGTPVVPALEGLLRDARTLRREQLRAAAQTAGPRMQLALVLLVVPGVMWLMLLATVSGLVAQLRGAGVV